MKIPGVSQKVSSVILAALLFFIVANPMTFKLYDALVAPVVGHGAIAGSSGCPTTAGLIAHGVIFGLLWVYVVCR